MSAITSEQPNQPNQSSQSPQPRKLRYLLDDERFLGSVMIIPAAVYIVALVGFPVLLAIAYAFSSATTGNPNLNFVGFETINAVIIDPDFQRALANTFVFTIISQALVIILANILAMALQQQFPGKWVFRFLILLPWAAPIALGTIDWLWMLDSLYSPIDYLLRSVGLLGRQGAIFGNATNLYWLGRENLSMVSVILVHMWRMLPLSTVILMAGLTSIPKDIKDAVAVDGVGFWREYFEVTLPLIRPITAVAVLFGTVFTFTDMTVVYVLTRGQNRTHVLASWAFFKGINGGNLAQGAAIALFLLPVLLAVVILVLRFARRSEIS
jgi:multiple sugar transport system permease protein